MTNMQRGVTHDRHHRGGPRARPRHGRALSAGGDDGGPASSAGDERGAFAVDVHAIGSRMLDGEGRVRRVHLHRPAGLQGAQVDGGAPGSHLELQEIRLVILETQVGGPSPDKSAAADLKLQVSRLRVRRLDRLPGPCDPCQRGEHQSAPVPSISVTDSSHLCVWRGRCWRSLARRRLRSRLSRISPGPSRPCAPPHRPMITGRKPTPSRQVMAEEASPGRFMKTEVIVPPHGEAS